MLRAAGTALLAMLALAVTPRSAYAGNDDAVLLGNQAIMSGGALTASVDDGSATWFNPAGLAQITRDSVDVSGNVYQLRIGAIPGLLSSAEGARADANYVDFVAVPSALTLVRRIDPNVVFGLGVFVPSMNNHDDRISLDEPFAGGEAMWRLHVHQSAQRYAAGACFGFRLASNLRVGVGLYGSYDEATDSIEFLGTAQTHDGAFGIAATTAATVRSVSFALGAGIQWEAVPGLLFGVAVQSPYVSVGSQYSLTSTTLTAAAGGVAFDPVDGSGLEPRLEVSAPARVRLGVALRLRTVLLSVDGDIQHELSSPAIGVERATTGGLRMGVRVRLDESISIGGGLFTDLSASRDPAAYGRGRVHYAGGSLGLEIRTRHALGQGEGAADIVFVQTFGIRYAYGVGTTGGLRFDLSSDAPALQILAVPTSVHEIGAHLGTGVYF